MAFRSIQIRYQTARSLPAPYAYFYTLMFQATPAGSLRVALSITYPDRDDIDDDELIAEGYTRNDDFSWQGELPPAWLKTVDALANGSKLEATNEDALDEDDDFWDVTVERSTPERNGVKPSRGRPANPDDWQYLAQELIQATYEASGREHPFTMTYLTVDGRGDETELRLTAAFARRTVEVVSLKNRQERTRTLPWSTLQDLMAVVYNHDYETEEPLLKRPRRAGKWLNLGTDEWHDVTDLSDLEQAIRKLQI